VGDAGACDCGERRRVRDCLGLSIEAAALRAAGSALRDTRTDAQNWCGLPLGLGKGLPRPQKEFAGGRGRWPGNGSQQSADKTRRAYTFAWVRTGYSFTIADLGCCA